MNSIGKLLKKIDPRNLKKDFPKEYYLGYDAGVRQYELSKPLQMKYVRCKYERLSFEWLAYRDGFSDGYMDSEKTDIKTT